MLEKINCKIEYNSNDQPKCKILVDGKVVHQFVGNKGYENFDFEVKNGPFTFTILHYGKDMETEIKKFIEIKKIYFNNVDIKNMIWDTIQVPTLPAWQNIEDFEWNANLYLGHNGYIEYKMSSPIIDFLLLYHTKGSKVSSNMGSYDMTLLYEMKNYFSKIVQEQDKKSRQT